MADLEETPIDTRQRMSVKLHVDSSRQVKISSASSTRTSSVECLPGCLLLSEVCTLPIDQGDGNGKKVKRFAYNPQKKKCKKFKYTGSGGNANNFKSKKECKKTCRVSS